MPADRLLALLADVFYSPLSGADGDEWACRRATTRRAPAAASACRANAIIKLFARQFIVLIKFFPIILSERVKVRIPRKW